MSELTAIQAMESLDRDRRAVQMSINQIIHILYDYIPRSCVREAEGKLFDAFFINGVELTSNMMRKEYEQCKKMELDSLMLRANPLVYINQ